MTLCLRHQHRLFLYCKHRKYLPSREYLGLKLWRDHLFLDWCIMRISLLKPNKRRRKIEVLTLVSWGFLFRTDNLPPTLPPLTNCFSDISSWNINVKSRNVRIANEAWKLTYSYDFHQFQYRMWKDPVCCLEKGNICWVATVVRAAWRDHSLLITFKRRAD